MRTLTCAVALVLLLSASTPGAFAQAVALHPEAEAAIHKAVGIAQRSERRDLGPEERALVAEAFRTRAAIEDAARTGNASTRMGTLRAQAQQLKMLVAERRSVAAPSNADSEVTRLEAALDQYVAEIEAIDALPQGSSQRQQRMDRLVDAHRRPERPIRPSWSTTRAIPEKARPGATSSRRTLPNGSGK